MNDQFEKNERDEDIARKLSQVAEQTHANTQFAVGLEERLRQVRQTKTRSLAASFKEFSPVLRWAVCMILLAVALSWSIKTLIPAPQPAADDTPVLSATGTPTPELTSQTATPASPEGGYDFRGAKLYLAHPLPQSPEQAYVYLLTPDEPATEEQARALGERFGIQGDLYTAPGLIYGTTDYVISNGKQFLQVHSNRYFVYASDMAKNNRNPNGSQSDNAEALIRDFLGAHGFDVNVRVSADAARGGYNVQPLSPDSIPMQYESFAQPVMRVTLDENGEILSMNASLMEYDPAPLGQYGIITAEEALQRLLDDGRPEGKMEFFHSPSTPFQDWYRNYPDNQPVTIYGNLASNPSTDPSQPALILIDGTPVVGNVAGMESLDYYTYVRATGHYFVEDGIRRFNVESWEPNIESAYLTGILQREGNQILLTTDDGTGQQYPLIDPPLDVPLNTEMYASQLSVEGVLVAGKLDWRFIRYIPDVSQSGGGGGGGGLGFYKLNLSGTPVPFPTPTTEPAAIQGPIEYVVQENDTLASIALNHAISVEELQKANGLPTDNMVFLGQRLIIPSPGSSSYTVQEGDTLNMIAQSFGITVEELMRINNMTDPTIYIGKILIVPKLEIAEQKVENLRGFLSIALHKKTDGTESREYSLMIDQDGITQFYRLEGPSLDELDRYHGLPILVSGTIRGTSTLVVDEYTIPFPDLQFQIVKGTQRSEQIEGQTAVIFTTADGESYVEFMGSTNQLTDSFIGLQGDPIQQEVLIVPDETFGGMPVARVYQSSVIEEGAPEMQIQADQIFVIDDTSIPDVPTNYVPPNLTIDNVELVYFVSNPYYQVNDPNYSQRSPHIQPAWHFHGRYEDGNEFDVLIQALQQDFLLPELVPGLSPG